MLSPENEQGYVDRSGIGGAYNDIMEFSKRFNAHIGVDGPEIPFGDTKELRHSLILEEMSETLVAINHDDLTEIADGIADSIVVLIGTAIAYGIPLDRVWREVHRSNMAKANPDGSVTRREDGKILKPEGWTAPNIKGVLNGEI